ncbi:MAG: TonB-dependent receptor plug domain-containing protein, partial [Flavipsychrobacter sp.]
MLLLCTSPGLQVLAQTDTTTHVLSPVVIKAYEQNTTLLNTAATVNTISPAMLQLYNNTSILSAVNTAPGVRMEERSPGSYRFSIRGSSLESPFGVRNVKVYYNDIPYTDPGGNTYLNQLGFYNMQSIEIIKGPGSSLYGAGTGGVLLINSTTADWQPGVSLSYTACSYNLCSTEGEVRLGDSLFQNTIRYQH